MAARLRWNEAQQQEAALQQLMLDALARDPPEFGLLVIPDDVDMFITTINRARAKDPLLQSVHIISTREGVMICYDPTKGLQNDQEI